MGTKPAQKSPQKRGRKPVDATLILVRLRPNELSRLDAARAKHGGDLSRPEAVRRVMERLREDALK